MQSNNSPFPFYWRIVQRLNEEYAIWVGDHGYDTRPFAFLKDGTLLYAPVAHTVEFASGHPTQLLGRGDIIGWLDSLPDDAVIGFPQYCGYRLDADECYDPKGSYFWYVYPQDNEYA